MNDEVILNKSASIEKCIKRIKEEYDDKFETNITKQEAIILNLERACQTCIDRASHVIRKKKLGIPQRTREVFALLKEHGIIAESMMLELQAMVGFRNIAVHEYSSLNLFIVKSIIEKNLGIFTDFSKIILQLEE